MTTPRFVDEHRLVIDAPRERVWAALRAYCDSLTRGRDGPLYRLLGTVPSAGFALAAEDAGSRVVLEGRHRFSRYRLVFVLRDRPGGGTVAAARTYADFPGPHGAVYRVLVIGSRAHAVAVRRMLRAVERASEA